MKTEAKIIRIEGRYEIVGLYTNGILQRVMKRLVTNWK